LGRSFVCITLDVMLSPGLSQFHTIASEEFDKLCFEFGIELDEDVSPAYAMTFFS
jgi:Phe-tRNA synthetase beta subunit B1 domain